MDFKPMYFKGKRVFVQVGVDGQPVLQNNRAVMKYNIKDDRTYSPSLQNLNLQPPEQQTLGGVGGGASGGRAGGAPGARRKKSTVKRPAPVASEDTIVAYTDGGCIGNPGPSGLGFVIRYPDGHVQQAGEPLGEGTNNIAELTAILRVLETVENKNAPLHIHTDSSYSIGVLTQNWKAKVNQQLIAAIKQQLQKFSNVHLVKVKGHAGNPDNELVDRLANGSARSQKRMTSA